MSLIETMINNEWLIEPDYLKKLYDIALRDKAVETYSGMNLSNTYNVEVRGDVAVIPVNGPIFRYANLFTQICGATSIELLAKDIQSAIDNPSIKGILLNIDSPGGQANGINELSEMIYQSRNIKPIKAYVGNLAASAAYFIASACDEIIIDDMASLGSIGVVSAISKRQDKETLEIVSTQSPNKRPDYSTEEGLKQVQDRADALADVFIEKVAKYRGLNSADVIEKGNKGGIRIGKDAVKYKLSDKLGNFEGVIKDMNEKNHGINAGILQKATGLQDASGEVSAAESILRSGSADVHDGRLQQTNQMDMSNVINEATMAERLRVKEILALGVDGAESLINEAIIGGKSKEETAMQLIDFVKKQKKVESLYVAPQGDDLTESAEERDEALLMAEINKRNRVR